jgi:hypothetical protein
VNDSLDVDPLEGSVGRKEVAVVHAGRRSNDEVRLRNQGNGTDFSQCRINLDNKLNNKKLVSSLQIDKHCFFFYFSRLRNQGNGTDFSQRRIDLKIKLNNKKLVSS